jgi:hypothetical protein
VCVCVCVCVCARARVCVCQETDCRSQPNVLHVVISSPNIPAGTYHGTCGKGVGCSHTYANPRSTVDTPPPYHTINHGHTPPSTMACYECVFNPTKMSCVWLDTTSTNKGKAAPKLEFRTLYLKDFLSLRVRARAGAVGSVHRARRVGQFG